MRIPIPVPTRRQALEQARRDPNYPGICHECGCTEYNPCITRGEPCGWANKRQTLCTAPACLDAALRKLVTALASEAKQNLENAGAIVGSKLFEFLQSLDGDNPPQCTSVTVDSEGVIFRFDDGFKVGWKR